MKEYGSEMERAINMSLDSFLTGEGEKKDSVFRIRRYNFDNERDKKKSTTLKAATPAASPTCARKLANRSKTSTSSCSQTLAPKKFGEKKARAEKQPRKRLEMFERLKQLKNEKGML